MLQGLVNMRFSPAAPSNVSELAGAAGAQGK